MNGPHEHDDAYVGALRGQLPSDADKTRVRMKLAAAGVSGTAALLPAAAEGATVAAKLELLTISKVLLAALGVAVVGGALYLALDSGSPRAPAPSTAELTAQEPAELPRAEPAPAAEHAPEEVVVEPVAEPRPKKRKARPIAEPPLDTLGEENALVGAAVNDASAARRLLDEHERRFPDGVLRAERERARRKLAD